MKMKLVSPEQMMKRMNATFDTVARRAFEIFEGNGRKAGQDLEHWLQAEAETLHPMHVDISDADGALMVRAEVPGFTEQDLEVSVQPRVLTISGHRESAQERKKGKTVYHERCSNEIFRTLELPATVDTASDAITANCDKGVLTISLPKAAEAKAREVPIQAKM